MSDEKYDRLIDVIKTTLESGRRQAVQAVNRSLVETYWHIGRHIVEYEQEGTERAEYGSGLLKQLSKDLRSRFGKGFSHSNINAMRNFYLQNPILQAVPAKLSWTILVELQKIEDSIERNFYQQQTLLENWSWRQLKRQKESMLFHRLALSKDKEGILALSKEGHTPKLPEDLMKDPYILEFLKIPEPYQIKEKELERRIIKHLKNFLLELGKGFAFVGEQYRISLANRHYYVDLVFYHRILKCFVLIYLFTDKFRILLIPKFSVNSYTDPDTSGINFYNPKSMRCRV